MNIIDKTEILAALKAKREELLSFLSSDHRAELINISPVADPLDRALQENSRELGAGEINRKTDLLNQVEAAITHLLHELDGIPFGVCENCEEDIPVVRLRVVPWTAVCRDCQEVREGGTGEKGGKANAGN